jgi:hypothetical protein
LSNVSSGQIIGVTPIDWRFPEMFLAFEAVAGTDYQIQFAGSDATNFHFRLLATNSPCIIEQPRSQTISTGDSVLFTVLAASGSPKGYQWQFNATNLPGETSPMLALDSPDASQAGPYQVIITNATGSVTSQVATLWVTTDDTAPVLKTTAASTNNEFAFRILGDVGRRYWMESSTNLHDWSPKYIFPTHGYGADYVAIGWTGSDGFVLLQSQRSSLRLRASTYHATNEVCNSHLKQLRFAMYLYGIENQLPSYAYVHVSFSDIMPYFKTGNIPSCPAGGTYAVTGWLFPPTCNLPWHVLDELYPYP